MNVQVNTCGNLLITSFPEPKILLPTHRATDNVTNFSNTLDLHLNQQTVATAPVAHVRGDDGRKARYGLCRAAFRL